VFFNSTLLKSLVLALALSIFFINSENKKINKKVELFTWEKLDYVDAFKKGFGIGAKAESAKKTVATAPIKAESAKKTVAAAPKKATSAKKAVVTKKAAPKKAVKKAAAKA